MMKRSTTFRGREPSPYGSDHRGGALVVTVIAVSSLLILTLAFLQVTWSTSREQAGNVDDTAAALLAEAAVSEALASLDDEIGDREDTTARSPYRSALESESAGIVDRAYLLYLDLYLLHFNRLSDKERRALTLVEVEGASYKEAAADLGIRLENLKMVIFRGRRKIFRGLNRTLEDLTSSPHFAAH